MKYLDLRGYRLILIGLIMIAMSSLFSAIFFIVTNSDVNMFIPEGQAQIGFETNEFETINFDLTGDSLWVIASDESYTGIYSIKSGYLTHNQNSTISIDLNIMTSGYMGFNYKVDSEYSTSGDEFYDGLKFYINGELIQQFQPDDNGNSSWQYYERLMSTGDYTFSWAYVKDGGDGSTASEVDCAWLDDLFFPVSEPLFYDYYNEPSPQDLSSGLFNTFIHHFNNQYNSIKAKGGTFADFDLDGDMDLYYGYTSGHYFENVNSSFIERTQSNDINNSGSRGVVVGDLDNNGYPDIMKWRYYFDNSYSHIALLNRGNHHFDRINYLDSDWLIDLHSQGLIDVDLDGDLDIVAVEKDGTDQFHCFMNNGLDDSGNLIFEHVFSYAREDENSSSRTLAISDFDNDGDQDVYVPRKDGKNWFFVNQTLTSSGSDIIYNENPTPLFVESSIAYGIADENNTNTGSRGYGAAWADYDNDDDFDLYLTNWGKNRLYQNDNNTFINIAENSNLESDSLSNGAGWGDFNNDGYIDLWSNNFKREDDLFLNPNAINQDWDNSHNPFYLSATQDVIPVDYNSDGWLDMFTPGLLMAHENGVEGAYGYKYASLLYKNILSDSLSYINNWLILDLEGSKIDLSNNGWTTQSNHSAIGARVIIHLSDLQISREIIAGKGHGSMDPLQLHFGLGNNISINAITIKWPSKDTLTNSQKIIYYEGPFIVNQKMRIVEDIGFVGLKGDVNYDESVNVIDIINIVHSILNEFPIDAEYLWAGDMDFTSELNINDIIKLVSFIFLP